jgi:hypothetical protein
MHQKNSQRGFQSFGKMVRTIIEYLVYCPIETYPDIEQHFLDFARRIYRPAKVMKGEDLEFMIAADYIYKGMGLKQMTFVRLPNLTYGLLFFEDGLSMEVKEGQCTLSVEIEIEVPKKPTVELAYEVGPSEMACYCWFKPWQLPDEKLLPYGILLSPNEESEEFIEHSAAMKFSEDAAKKLKGLIAPYFEPIQGKLRYNEENCFTFQVKHSPDEDLDCTIQLNPIMASKNGFLNTDLALIRTRFMELAPKIADACKSLDILKLEDELIV